MADESALPVPHFPGYRILSSLGSYLGTQRFKAIQVALGRPVVLHVLTSETAKKGMCAAFFDRQQNVLATLRHENVVGAIEAGEVDGHRYFVLEHSVSGEPTHTVMGGWTRSEQGDTHLNMGDGPLPTPSAFLHAIGQNLCANYVGARTHMGPR